MPSDRHMMMTEFPDLDDMTSSNVVKTLLQGGANLDIVNDVSLCIHTRVHTQICI